MSTTMPTSLSLANIGALSSAVLTVTASAPPVNNSKRSLITALASGTATGFRAHTVSDPFDLTVYSPSRPQALPSPNVNGVRPNIPVNTHTVNMRKGLRPASDVASIPSQISTKLDVPAGAESYDVANLSLMIAAHAKALEALADDLYDNAQTGSV